MGNYRFSMAPNISVPRSKFKMPFNHVTSFFHGKLVPIDCIEILAGDEFKLDFSAIIRMSTPIAPIFGNIKAHVHAFFVPMRLIWEHTKEFYGENKTSAGYQTYNYQIPRANYGAQAADYAVEGSVSHYLGKPIGSNYQTGTKDQKVSVLKERGYYLIWSEYFRAQQIQGPVLLTVDDTGGIGTIQAGNSDGIGSISFATKPMNVCKEFDYITACTRAPQYGAAVTLPLGSYAPIIVGYDDATSQGISQGTGLVMRNTDAITAVGETSTIYASSGSYASGLLADLSNATAASINSIRYAFACQKWLERANFGSRFFEMLNLHFGVTSPDARLQRPEYLGGKDFYINVDQVLSTAGYDNGTSTEVGQTGAVSVTAVKGLNLMHKAFVEPGYLYVLISTTHERSYSQGLLREDLRADRFDFYFPEFANLGDQLVTNKEVFFDNSATDDNGFGFQEHWAEYRYRPNRVSGLLDPAVSVNLAFWDLGDLFTATPTLSDVFIMENRNSLARCLTTGATGPDYIGDFYLDYTAIREMPLYTIPGLIDHFGTM